MGDHRVVYPLPSHTCYHPKRLPEHHHTDLTHPHPPPPATPSATLSAVCCRSRSALLFSLLASDCTLRFAKGIPESGWKRHEIRCGHPRRQLPVDMCPWVFSISNDAQPVEYTECELMTLFTVSSTQNAVSLTTAAFSSPSATCLLSQAGQGRRPLPYFGELDRPVSFAISHRVKMGFPLW